MADSAYRAAHVSDLPTPAGADPGESAWRAVRMHFGIGSFGVSAYVAEAPGEILTSAHDEVNESGTRHEELFFVASGHAVVTVGDESVDAPAGTFVHVPAPEVVRGATALEAGTTLIVVGGEPGRAYEVSPWERAYLPDA